MKNQKQKDNKKRNSNLNFENKHLILKSVSKNSFIKKPVRWNSELKATGSTAIASNNLVNRCILTGRKKMFHKSFRLSRLSFLKIARKGLINGIKKSIK
jgi:ribosomal protein S14